MKNYMNLSRSEVNSIVNEYILNCIPDATEIKSSWGIDVTTDKERLNFVFDCYQLEYNYEQNKKIYPNNQARFANWLMGLPSAINVDFENYTISEIGKKWGYLKSDATDKEINKFTANWFNAMAFKIIRLHEKMNKTPKPKAIKKNYTVSVGNVGNIEYTSKKLAIECYNTYVSLSKNNQTRASGEDVVLFENGEPMSGFEYFGTNDNF